MDERQRVERQRVERQRDQRDLNILLAYEHGATKASLLRSYGVTRHYLDKLLKEANDE